MCVIYNHIFLFSLPLSVSNLRPQYQAYSELGKTISDNVPFVRVCDVITFMPQINYMVNSKSSIN
jgi:hypothetical protein